MNRLTKILGIAIASVLGYGVFIEPRWVELKRVKIHARGLPAALEGLRIGLLSDLHAGRESSLRLVRRSCALLLAESPDLIAVTGDIVDENLASFRPVLGALSRLTAPHGVYAVPGNHDYRLGLETWQRELAHHTDIVDLTNRTKVLNVGGARLCVAGVDDFAEGQPSLSSLPHPDERDFTILLAHNPDQAERSRREYDGIDLIVSGHTHGGQVRVPGLGPILSSVENDELYEEGLRRRPWTQVYTSRGIGTVHLPIRLFTRPEVTVLELTGAARPPLRR
jgi:uncharacterized protein